MKKIPVLLSAFLMVATMLFAVSCGDSDASKVSEFVKGGSQVFSTHGDNLRMEARGTAIVFMYTHDTIPETDYARTSMIEYLDGQFTEETLFRLYKSMKAECPEVTAIAVEYYEPGGDLLVSYQSPNPNKTYVDFVAETCYNNIVNNAVA